MDTLVLVSHPTLDRSRANARVVAAIRDLPDQEIRHLEALYPDGRLDVAAEQTAAVCAGRIVFQFPFYWYSTPLLLKRWQDEVFAFGWAYGPGGTKLKGKTPQLELTTGGTSPSTGRADTTCTP